MQVGTGSHPQMTAAQIGFKPPPGNESRTSVDLPGPNSGRECRFHFDHGQSRNDALVCRSGEEPLHEIAALLPSIVLD